MFTNCQESCVVRRSDESGNSDGNKIAFVESKKVCPKMFIESESNLAHEPATKNMASSFNDAFSAFITQKSTKRPHDMDDIDYADEVAPINSKIARVEFKPRMKSMILKNHFENKIDTLTRPAVSLDLMKPCENGVISGGGIPVNDTANINNSPRTDSLLNFIAKSTKSIRKVVGDANDTLAEKERSFRAACNALANLSKKNVGVHRDVANNSFVTRIESNCQVVRNGGIESNVRESRSLLNHRPVLNSGSSTCFNESTSAVRIPASCDFVRNLTSNCKSRNTDDKQTSSCTGTSGNNFVMMSNQKILRNTRATSNGLSYDASTASTVRCNTTALSFNSAQNSRRSTLRRRSYDVCDTSLLGSCRNRIDCTTGRERSSDISFPGCQSVYVSVERLTLNQIERIKNQLKSNNYVAALPRKLESPRKIIDAASVGPPAVTTCSEPVVIIDDCSSDSFHITDYIVADLEADLRSSLEETKPKSEKMSPSRKRLSTISSQTNSLPEQYLYEETSQDSTEFNQSLIMLSECKKSKKKKSELILPISSKKLNEIRLAGEYVPNFMTHDDCGQELKRNATFLLSEWWLNDYGECTDITSLISNVSDWFKIDEFWRKKKLMSKKNIFFEKFDDCASRDSFLSTELGEIPKIDDAKSSADLNFQIDKNEECFFLPGARATQCQETVSKIEDLFHSNKSSTTLLQFYLPDKRQKKCYTRLVSRGRKTKTANNVDAENKVEEVIPSLDADHFLKRLSLYVIELSLHEILWPPELLANLKVPDTDAIQAEQLSECQIKLADKLEESISLKSEIKPNPIKNDDIENESKTDKKTKRPRIKKVVVYDSIESEGLIVSLPKPVKCSVKKTLSTRVKKSDLNSSIINNVTSPICIADDEHIVSVDSNIDNNIANDVNNAVEIMDENDASSIDVENGQESVVKVINICRSAGVDINKVIYDETGNILIKSKRRAVVKVRVPKKNNSKPLVVPPSECVEGGSVISELVPNAAIVSSDNVTNLIPSDQTVLSDNVTTLAPSDKSVIVDSASLLVPINKTVSSECVSVLSPSEVDVLTSCVSIPSASVACTKQKAAVKRVRKKKPSDITLIPNETGDVSVLVTDNVNCGPDDSVQETTDPGTKKKAAPRKRPPRKKKSECSNVTSENSNILDSHVQHDNNIVQISSESDVKPKTVARKRPPRKKQSVDKQRIPAGAGEGEGEWEENSLISVSNSFMAQENSNSLQQFCADISLNNFGNDQCEDNTSVPCSYSDQRYTDSRSVSTDFRSMSSSTGLMDTDLMNGDLVNSSCNNSNQVGGNYLPGLSDSQPMMTNQGSCNAGAVSNDYFQGSYHHSSQINNDVDQRTNGNVAINYNFTPSCNDLESGEKSNVAQMDCNSYQIGNNSLEVNRNLSTVVPPCTDRHPGITAEIMNYDGGDTPSPVTTGGVGGYNDISSWLAASMGL